MEIEWRFGRIWKKRNTDYDFPPSLYVGGKEQEKCNNLNEQLVLLRIPFASDSAVVREALESVFALDRSPLVKELRHIRPRNLQNDD